MLLGTLEFSIILYRFAIQENSVKYTDLNYRARIRSHGISKHIGRYHAMGLVDLTKGQIRAIFENQV